MPRLPSDRALSHLPDSHRTVMCWEQQIAGHFAAESGVVGHQAQSFVVCSLHRQPARLLNAALSLDQPMQPTCCVHCKAARLERAFNSWGVWAFGGAGALVNVQFFMIAWQQTRDSWLLRCWPLGHSQNVIKCWTACSFIVRTEKY